MDNIAKFYENKSLLVFGATGFVGKVLVEKLLRACGSLKVIYVVIRGKKNGELIGVKVNRLILRFAKC